MTVPGKSRVVGQGMQFPWRWDDGTISTNLDFIWGMLVQKVSRIARSRGMPHA